VRCEIGRGVTRIFNETLYTRTGKLNEEGGERRVARGRLELPTSGL
jgi:hypothetical protein